MATRSPLAPPAVVAAEPVTIFHYEVLTVTDNHTNSKVAKLTSQMLYITVCLVIVAVINFVIDLSSDSLSLTSAILNLLIALSLPACGIIGVRDRNISCIQYFCCCAYFCAFLTALSLISAIILVALGNMSYLASMILLFFFFFVYWKGGGVSQRLASQPYFTSDRVSPQRTYHIHENTVEVSPQPVAQVELSQATPAAPAPYSASAGPVPTSAGTSSPAQLGGGADLYAPHSIVVVGASAPGQGASQSPPSRSRSGRTSGDMPVPGLPLGTSLDDVPAPPVAEAVEVGTADAAPSERTGSSRRVSGNRRGSGGSRRESRRNEETEFV